MLAETLYEGPAHEATFYLPAAGVVRFAFSNYRAGGYVRSRDGSLFRVQPGARLFLSAGHHVLTLYDPQLLVRVSVVFEPD
jgi:hypothetical protein